MQPADVGPHADVRARLAPADRIALAIGSGVITVAIAVAAAIGWQPISALGLIIGALIVIGSGVRIRRLAEARRLQAAMTTWGRANGFLYLEAHGNPAATPLLRRTGRLGPVLLGPVGSDPKGLLAHCRATLSDGRADPDGEPFTVAIARVPEAQDLGFRIGAHNHRVAAALDDWRSLPTESTEIDDRFVIEVRDGHDPIPVRSLLEPVVLAAMLREDPAIGVEFEDGWLVTWRRGHAGISDRADDIVSLERLLAQADRWDQRLRDTAR